MSDSLHAHGQAARPLSPFDRSARPWPGRRIVVQTWLEEHPIALLAAGLTLGIAVDAWLAIPFVLGLLMFMIGSVIAIRSRARLFLAHGGLLLTAIATGALLHDLHDRRWPADHIVRYTGDTPIHVYLTGTVVEPPTLHDTAGGSFPLFAQLPQTRFLVEAERLRGRHGPIRVQGLVAVTVREPLLELVPGDRIEIVGTIFRPMEPSNPGCTDWARIRRRQKILVQTSAEHAACVRVVKASHTSWNLAALRRKARRAILDVTYENDVPGAQILSAMVLGQRSGVDPEINEAFVNSGTVHYLSVSGAHVGMLASAVWLVGIVSGMSQRKMALIAMIVVTSYALLAEPRAPIIRATIMADVFCLAILLRRPARNFNWLAMAMVILLIVNPAQLFHAGFQLSFVTVWAVIYLSPRVHAAGESAWIRLRYGPHGRLLLDIRRHLEPPRVTWGSRVRYALGWYVAVALSAWSVSLLLASWHFGQVSMWGWLGSLLAMPLVWLALVLGLLKTVITFVFPPAGALLAPCLRGVTELLILLVQAIASLPGSGWRTNNLPGWLVAGALLILALVVMAPRLRIGHRWLAMAGAAWMILYLWQVAPPAPADRLHMQILSVGSGSASVIHLPDGRTLLYDLGAFPPYDIEKWTLGPYLAHRRISRIDGVLVSHANWDHYGGMFELLQRRRVNRIFATPHFRRQTTPDDLGGKLLQEIDARGTPWIELSRGYTLTGTGDVRVDVLWPPPVGEWNVPETNETSLVVRISYGGKRVLLCGDIQGKAQERLMASTDLRADVLILPHHGGMDATTAAFIAAVDPTYCIRSSGQRDEHTGNGLLKLMEGRTYYNTANNGAVEVTIEPGALMCRPYRTDGGSSMAIADGRRGGP